MGKGGEDSVDRLAVSGNPSNQIAGKPHHYPMRPYHHLLVRCEVFVQQAQRLLRVLILDIAGIEHLQHEFPSLASGRHEKTSSIVVAKKSVGNDPRKSGG